MHPRRASDYGTLKVVVPGIPVIPPLIASARTWYVPLGSLGFGEYFTLAVPAAAVVAVSVVVPPCGFFTVTVTPAPDTADPAIITLTAMVTELLPLPLPIFAVEVETLTLRLGATHSDTDADPARPELLSTAENVTE